MHTEIVEAEVRLEHYAKKLPPSQALSLFRILASYPRYWLQLYASRKGYQAFRNEYPQNILFIAGLPKSGTTWIEQILSGYKGFSDIYLPEALLHEVRNGNSHTFDLPAGVFGRFKDRLAVIKTHAHASPSNTDILRKANVRYAIVFRDLRDVAVSYFFFVRARPWHPEFPYYKNLTASEGLQLFGERTLLDYMNWILGWIKDRDGENSILVRYESMLDDPQATLVKLTDHFQLGSQSNQINAAAGGSDTSVLSRTTQKRTVNQQSTHFRKGIKGDWRNFMTPEVKHLYKDKIGDFLIELGYEKDHHW